MYTFKGLLKIFSLCVLYISRKINFDIENIIYDYMFHKDWSIFKKVKAYKVQSNKKIKERERERVM